MILQYFVYFSFVFCNNNARLSFSFTKTTNSSTISMHMQRIHTPNKTHSCTVKWLQDDLVFNGKRGNSRSTLQTLVYSYADDNNDAAVIFKRYE